MARYVKGQSGNPVGKPFGTKNKVTNEFKVALNNLLKESSPKIQKWLDHVAAEDPGRALDCLCKLAEYIHPKLARQEHVGDPEQPIESRLVVESFLSNLTLDVKDKMRKALEKIPPELKDYR